MSFLYRSQRVGQHGKPIEVLKIRTLRDGTDKTSSFARQDQYLWYGRFLRRTKLDELPQIWNILKGDMNIFGYRPMEERELPLLPEGVKEVLLKAKPGLMDLASIAFYDEEKILQQMSDPSKIYYELIRPIKFTLQAFYIEHKNWMLDLAILYMAFTKVIPSFFKRT